MRTVSIVGARPQFVKLAPVSRAMAEYSRQDAESIDDVIVHTGQHYDENMSKVFFDELQIPRPSVDLDVGSGQHGEQTARMLTRIEEILIADPPDMVIIYGDTNSTIAGALAATKLHIPVAHIEAGLRSFNRQMPEEINRLVADHISDLLLAPTQTAMQHLERENLGAISRLVGDVMFDAVQWNRKIAEERESSIDALGLPDSGYGVVTLHRPANTDTQALGDILGALNRIATERLPLVFPIHPRTSARITSQLPSWSPSEHLCLIDPVGYLDMLRLVGRSRVVLTDSGGLQKEAFFLGVPCVTLREETEWPETVMGGGNTLVGSRTEDLDSAIEQSLTSAFAAHDGDTNRGCRLFGDGRAADAIIRELLEFSRR